MKIASLLLGLFLALSISGCMGHSGARVHVFFWEEMSDDMDAIVVKKDGLSSRVDHLLFFSGLAMNMLGRHEYALQYFKEGLSLYPNDQWLLLQLANTLSELRHYKEAEDLFIVILHSKEQAEGPPIAAKFKSYLQHRRRIDVDFPKFSI